LTSTETDVFLHVAVNLECVILSFKYSADNITSLIEV
jgi:hypothetical protein